MSRLVHGQSHPTGPNTGLYPRVKLPGLCARSASLVLLQDSIFQDRDCLVHCGTIHRVLLEDHCQLRLSRSQIFCTYFAYSIHDKLPPGFQHFTESDEHQRKAGPDY